MDTIEKNIELFSKFETIDFETGELVNVLDAELPVRNRLDAGKWLIDRFNAEIDICKNRKALWNERENIIKLGVDKVREAIKCGMQNEGFDKIKTLENTAFLTSKDLLTCDESQVKPEQKYYDITIKDAPYGLYKKLSEFAEAKGYQTAVKEKVIPEKLPADLVTPIKQVSLTIRKSAKTE